MSGRGTPALTKEKNLCPDIDAQVNNMKSTSGIVGAD